MVASTVEFKTEVKQMVFMRSPIGQSFAAQSETLMQTMRRHFIWPSPDAGFALYVYQQIGRQIPIKLPLNIETSSLQVGSQAPELAAFGFYAASRVPGANRITTKGWQL